jgi:CheY-like chemotaxis protein
MGNCVLIIDHDRDFPQSFLEEVKKVDESATVQSAENGYLALQLLKLLTKKIPDFIFVDVKMPIMDGHEIVHEIRRMKEFSTIPIIMYGTLPDGDEKTQALRAGANYYYQKPTSASKLHQMIKEVFKNQYGHSFS